MRALAHQIVAQNVAVQPGEVVVIEGGKHTIPLMEDLAIEAELAGGLVTMFLDSDRVVRALNVDVPERFLSQKPRFFASWLRQVDVYITLPNVSDLRALDAGVSAKRLGELAAGGDFLTPLLDSMRYRALNITYPTAARGQSFGLNGASYTSMVWAAMGADYGSIAKKGRQLQRLLQAAKTGRITSPDGTDLRFSFAGRKSFLSDGIITKSGAAGKKFTDRTAALPDGTITVAPLESSADGKVVIPRTTCRFETLKAVSMNFRNGKAENMTAASGMDCFNQQLAASGGPTMMFAGFSIGLNPAWKAHQENGAAYFPSPGAGIVYVNVGDDQLIGGSNKTVGNFGAGFPIANATVYIDGKKIEENGKLLI